MSTRFSILPGVAPAKRTCWRCGKSMPFTQQVCRACWDSFTPEVKAAVMAEELPSALPERDDPPAQPVDVQDVSKVNYLAWLKYMAARGESVPSKAVVAYIEQMQAAHKAEIDQIIRDAQDDLQQILSSNTK